MNNNTVTVTICIDTARLETIDDIEKAVQTKTRQAAKQLMKQIFEAKEQKIFKEEKLVKKQKVQRYLYTVFGLLKFTRYKAKDKKGKLCYPLDRVLCIDKASSFSPGLQKRATFLCTMYPYRQAKDILSYEISAQIDHRALWRLVQKKGIKLKCLC